MAIPSAMKYLLVFIFFGIGTMFIDGLYYDNYITRPAMSMMHMEMKPILYKDPSPPSLEEYWAQYRQFEDLPADMDDTLDYVLIPDGQGGSIKQYRLSMENVLHEIRPGVKVPMFSFNKRIPAPTLHLQEGDHVQVVFFNNGTEPHTIHWHGINSVDSHTSDGVPDVNQRYVYPGETYIYNFTANEPGTKMYHCHVEAPHHMTMGMFGAIIIDPKEGTDAGSPFARKADDGSTLEMGAATHDVEWFLHEFDAKHAHVVMPNDMMSMGPDTALPWLIPSPKFAMPFMPEFNEFMINGKSFPAAELLNVKEGDIVRMRLLNIGEVYHSIHWHGHTITVTHKDGYPLPAPYKVDVLSIAPGERYDVWFRADNPGIWMIHEHAALSAMANGYDPAGIMSVIVYPDQDMTFLNELLERIKVYNEYIMHQDEDHGMLTKPGTIGVMMDMGGSMTGMGH